MLVRPATQSDLEAWLGMRMELWPEEPAEHRATVEAARSARALWVKKSMQFTKRVRQPVKSGEITTSIRIWKQARVKVGNRYALEEGHVVVDKLTRIEFEDITPRLARESGFAGVADLLKTAKHGSGESVYLVEFHYEPPTLSGD